MMRYSKTIILSEIVLWVLVLLAAVGLVSVIDYLLKSLI